MTQVLDDYTAASAASFINSIGVCGAANATTAVQLAYLGIDNLRTNTLSSSDLLAAGADGAKMDVILPYYFGNVTTSTIAGFLSEIDPAASVIEAVEGPNEVNVDPDTFYGLSGPAAIEGIQEALYTLSKADPALNNATHTTAVYDFSVGVGSPTDIYNGMSAYADYNNVHSYGSDGVPPSWFLPNSVSGNTIAGTQPVVITETGYETMPGSGVDQATQARLDIETLLDGYQLGAVKTYLYDLQDWATGNAVNDFSAYYGLYTTDGTPKLAATAIHNLTTVLSSGDASGGAASGGSLDYAISGLAYYGKTELFSKPQGVFDLVVWNETLGWNQTANQEVAIPANAVTLTLGQTFGTISVYDPLVSASPIAVWSNTDTVTVSVSNDPLIIELMPAMTATASIQTVNTKDSAAVSPFSDVVISDPNPGQTETAIVTLSAVANGTLSDPNAAYDGGIVSNGTYSVSGVASAVASALDGLVFTPTAHQAAPGQTVTTSVTAVITDTEGTQSTISSTVANTGSGLVQTDPLPVLTFTGSAPCFVAGTHILTALGEREVEALEIGDVARTHNAGLAPITWIGHRRIDCRRHAAPETVWPVRICPDAFAPGMPHSEVWLSPDHAVFADGLLIPIKHLINGATIAQIPRDTVTYFHVELARHAILMAEGLPAESYLDTGNRATFENTVPPPAPHHDLAPSDRTDRAA